MFDLVEQTIKANQDIVLKLKLLKDKVEELKELFQNTPYDDLLNLRFVIEKPTKPKRKYVKKKVKVEEEKPTGVYEDNNAEVVPADETITE